jgi:uncharacterized protein
VGSAGGITTLISYPALLAVGLPPLAANMTNAVSLAAYWPGSVAASQPELRGRWPWLRRWLPLTAIGGACGAALLLSTPEGTFERVVPYLVAMASVLLLFQPRISRWREGRATGSNRWLAVGVFGAAFYVGYFGAGGGVMVLAMLLLTVEKNVARANALKNVLMGMASIFAGIGFALFGHVHWAAVPPLAVGVLAGSAIGPSITRRVPGNLLRVLVALTGFALAIRLWIGPL